MLYPRNVKAKHSYCNLIIIICATLINLNKKDINLEILLKHLKKQERINLTKPGRVQSHLTKEFIKIPGAYDYI